MAEVQRRSRWVYFLPLLHLFIYVAGTVALYIPGLQQLGIVTSYIMLADLPISFVADMIVWNYGYLAALWILIVGTLWWYLLSLGIRWLFDAYEDHQARPLSIRE